jgi:hypothetical protein
MQSIKDWAASGSVKNILQFLGSSNFYRHFIDGFSKVARPLTALTAFNWAEAARSALVTSKHFFTVAPIRETKGPIWWHITRGNSSQPT